MNEQVQKKVDYTKLLDLIQNGDDNDRKIDVLTKYCSNFPTLDYTCMNDIEEILYFCFETRSEEDKSIDSILFSFITMTQYVIIPLFI